jgi:hypothetical protein
MKGEIMGGGAEEPGPTTTGGRRLPAAWAVSWLVDASVEAVTTTAASAAKTRLNTKT